MPYHTVPNRNAGVFHLSTASSVPMPLVTASEPQRVAICSKNSDKSGTQALCWRFCSLSLSVECLIKQISRLCGHFDKEVTEDDFRLIAPDRTRGLRSLPRFRRPQSGIFPLLSFTLEGETRLACLLAESKAAIDFH